jgi:fatty acid desaturase
MKDDRNRSYAPQSAVQLVPTALLAAGPVAVGITFPHLLTSFWLFPLLFLQAIGLTAVSNAAHESVHGHLFGGQRVDRAAGRILHGVLLLNHDVHRRYHLTHHAYLGTDQDSEGAFDFDDLPHERLYFQRALRWAVPPSPLHVLNWSWGVQAALGRSGPPGRPLRRERVALGFVIPVTVLALLAFWTLVQPLSALLVGWLPLLVAFPLYTYLTALPEHFGLSRQADGRLTRNIRTNAVLQYLLWNINLHAVHHAYPQLNFSELPARADDVDAPVANGYLRFHIDLLRRIGKWHASPTTLGTRS